MKKRSRIYIEAVMRALTHCPKNMFQQVFAMGLLAGVVFGGLFVVLYMYDYPAIYLVAGISTLAASVLAIYPVMAAGEYMDEEIGERRGSMKHAKEKYAVKRIA